MKDLTKMTLTQLKEIAKEMGIVDSVKSFGKLSAKSTWVLAIESAEKELEVAEEEELIMSSEPLVYADTFENPVALDSDYWGRVFPRDEEPTLSPDFGDDECLAGSFSGADDDLDEEEELFDEYIDDLLEDVFNETCVVTKVSPVQQLRPHSAVIVMSLFIVSLLVAARMCIYVVDSAIYLSNELRKVDWYSLMSSQLSSQQLVAVSVRS
jgi:hypothetical protein